MTLKYRFFLQIVVIKCISKSNLLSHMIEAEGKVSFVYSFLQMGLIGQHNAECQKMSDDCNDSKC